MTTGPNATPLAALRALMRAAERDGLDSRRGQIAWQRAERVVAANSKYERARQRDRAARLAAVEAAA